MKILQLTLIIFAAVLLVGTTALAADPASGYTMISAAELEARLKAGEPTHIVDIQVEEEFSAHHIVGATPTHAYPVKSDADRAKLDAVLKRISADDAPVVIVCPRGAGGATRTYDYLLTRDVAAERLQILEKGQQGWTCTELTEGK